MTCALALVASMLVAAAPAERVVALVPLGKVDPALLKVAVEAIEAKVACKVRVESERELPKAAWYAPRKRWRAEKLLEALGQDPPQGTWKVVGFTAAEISTTKGSIADWRVGGQGEVGGRACVVSSWINERHAKTKADLHRRIADLVVHEVGHTLGAAHCESKGCVMRDAEGRLLETQDASTGQFCDACRKKVGEATLRR
ncbi:MAG TPA: hypothetical protein VGK67_05160 [Myxococcales bacterium]|jgi:archaemetzincin